jgi:hypothetical protein
VADFEVSGEASLDPEHLIEDVSAIIDKFDELMSKVDEVSAKLDEISHKDISIAVLIDGMDKLDELKLFLDEIDSHDYTAKIKVDILDKDQLDKLYIDILELELYDHNVDVKVTTSGIADTEAKLKALNATTDDTSKKLDKVAKSSDGFKFSLMALAPLLIPIASATIAAAGGVMGMAAAFGAMAVPALAFGLAAKSVYTNITTLITGLDANTTAALANATSYKQIYSILNSNSTAFHNMDSAMQTVTVGYVMMKNALTTFQNAIQLPVTMVLYDTFHLLSQVLGYLTPAVYAFGMALNLVILNFSTRLKDPTFQKFFKDATANMGTLVTDWGGGFVNIIEGLTALLDAFLPVGVKMSNGFLQMTKDFDNWAQKLSTSEGFKKFLGIVETDGPVILKILGQVILFVAQLVGVLGTASVSHTLFNDLLQLLSVVNKFLATHPGMAQFAADLLLIGVAAWKLGPALGPLMSFIASPIGIAVVAILALGLAFVYAYNKSAEFRDWVNKNLKPLWDQLTHDVSQFTNAMTNLWPTIEGIWKRFLPQLTLIAQGEMTNLVGIFGGLFQIIAGIFQLFSGILSGKWGLIWKGLLNILEGFGTLVGGMMMGFLTMMEGIIESLGKIIWGLIGHWVTQWVANFVTFVSQTIQTLTQLPGQTVAVATRMMAQFNLALVNGIVAAVNWFNGLPGRVVSALGNLGSILWNAGSQLIQGFINGIVSEFNSVQSTLSSLTNWLTSWKGPPSKDKTLLYSSGQMIIDGFVNGLESRYAKVANSLGGLTKTVGSQFGSQFTTDISAKVNASLNAKMGTSVGSGGNMAGGSSVVFSSGSIQINNPSPEPASQSLTKMLQSTAAFGIVQAPMGANFPGGS